MNYLIEEQLIPVLMRYSLRDLKFTVDTGVFPGIRWNDVKRICRNRHLDLTNKTDLVPAIIRAFKKVQPNSADVVHTYCYIRFIDSYLNKFIYWYAAYLFNKESEGPKSPRKLEERIRQMYEKDYWKAVVYTKKKGDIIFIMQLEKKNTRRIKYGEPFFAAVKLRGITNYFFFSSTINEEIDDHLKILQQALGYRSHFKLLHIHGNNVDCMFKTMEVLEQNENNNSSSSSNEAGQSEEDELPPLNSD